MKLDVNVLRYMSKDEFRVLTAVEMVRPPRTACHRAATKPLFRSCVLGCLANQEACGSSFVLWRRRKALPSPT